MADDIIKISATQELRNPRRNSIVIPDSPDNGKTMLPASRRASVGSCHVVGNSRRNSTGKPTSQNSGENVIPHYLRSSTGSCHDLCKYGSRKHTNEVKPWKIKPKRAVASSSEEPNNTNVLVGDRKKTTTVKLNPSPEPPDVIKQNNTSVVRGERKKSVMMKLKPSPEPSEVIKQNTETVIPRGRKKTTLKLEPSPEPSEVIKQNTETVIPRGRKKTTTLKLEPSSEPPEVIKKNNVNVVPGERKKIAVLKNEPSPEAIKPNNTTVVPGERKKMSTIKLEPSSEPPVVLKKSSTTSITGERKKTTMGQLKSTPEPEVIKREILPPSKKVEVSSIARRISDKDLKMPVKRSPSLKQKPAVVTPSSSSDASAGSNGRRKGDEKTGKKTGPVKAVVKKFLVIPSVSLSPKSPVRRVLNLKARKGKNLKQVSPLKDQNRLPNLESVSPCNNKIHEKTIHIVESDPVNNVFESLQTDGIVQSLPGPPSVPSPKLSPHTKSQGSYSEGDYQDYSEYTNSEEENDDYISESDEIVNPSRLETLQEADKRGPQKGKSSVSEEKDATAVKLKFRRGRIVDVESENTGPRRLRFRRGRILDDRDDQSGSKRRTYKKRGDDETKDSTLGAEKVVLKHQDVQGKKDTQGLFNNVIEETASKLVETRKSKVKALVGAFETVISLQDSKPST